MSNYGADPVFQKLRMNIERLKNERQELNGQMNVDRNDLMTVQSSMNELGRELDVRNNIIREKQRKLMEIEKAINETEKSYDIIVDTTRKLSSALESQSSHLRTMVRR